MQWGRGLNTNTNTTLWRHSPVLTPCGSSVWHFCRGLDWIFVWISLSRRRLSLTTLLRMFSEMHRRPTRKQRRLCTVPEGSRPMQKHIWEVGNSQDYRMTASSDSSIRLILPSTSDAGRPRFHWIKRCLSRLGNRSTGTCPSSTIPSDIRLFWSPCAESVISGPGPVWDQPFANCITW